MKKVLFVLFLCFLIRACFGGCSGPQISIKIKPRVGPSTPPSLDSYTFYVNPNDSFSLRITGGSGSCNMLNRANILFNNQNLANYSSGYDFFIQLACIPGVYKINAENNRMQNSYWTILLIETKVIVDTSSITSQSTTNIPAATKILNPDFLFYPNPAQDEITLSNESDEIRSVTFYSSSGLLFSKYEMRGSKVTVPLNNYPRGIYFMQAATVSGRLIVRKLTVL